MRRGRDAPAVARAGKSLRLSLAFAFLLGGAAAAEAQEPNPFRVEESLFVILPGGQGVGQERTVVPKDELLRTRVGYAAAARLSAPVSAMLAGVPIDVPLGPALPEVRAMGGTRDRVGRDARIFCASERRVDHLAPPPPPQHPPGRRFDKRVMPCFVDRDRDGRLDSAFLIGTKWPSDRVLVPIEPVAYTELNDIPLPGSSAWITFEKGGLLEGPVLQLHVTMFGRPLPIAAVRLGSGDDRHRYTVSRSVKRETYPYDIEVGAASIALLGYEPEGRRLRVRVDKPFGRDPIEFEFISNVIYIYH